MLSAVPQDASPASEVAPSFGLDQWLEFAGHLHPLLLHLPIGLFGAVVIAEIVCAFRQEERPLRRWLYIAFGLSAAAAAFTGWQLGLEDDYRGALVDEHRTYGLAVAGAALLAMLLDLLARSRMGGVLRFVALVACGGLITMAGHRGGMLTHGSRFLSETAPPWLAPYVGPERGVTRLPEGAGAGPVVVSSEGDAEAAAGEPPATAATLADAVASFQTLCVECHGPDKQKGKLRLDVAEGWLAQVDVDDPEFSELLYRVTLPADDPDAMPPEEDPRVEPAHVAAVRAWIERGAPVGELGLGTE